ncbi:MAG: glycosyltransferase family 2 protein [Candidatus Aenigmatarchaeota archaeon]
MDVALIPAFNEEENIYEVVTRAKKIGLIPIVIDDCSTDKTSELARKAGAMVLRHEKNKGKGEALKTGFEFLRRMNGVENVALMDADMQYLPESSKNLLDILKEKNVHIALGSRNFKKIPLRHRFGNFVWRNSFNLLFGTNFSDTNCGLMALTKDAIEKIKDGLQGGYIVENSILVQALKNNLKIEQAPVEVSYKKVSGFLRGIRVVLGVLIFILKEGFKYRLERS